MLERSQVVPNVYQGYYQDGYRDIVKEADERYMSNLSAWQLFFWEQIIDRKVYLGDQRYLNSYTSLSYENQKYIFNPVMPVINTICGRQRQHRKATQMLPTHGSSSKTASQATKTIQCAYKNDKTYHKISDCFKESAGITGLALLHSYMDYRRDPICGDLATEMLTADMLMMDAFWRERNLSDCQFIRTRKYLWRQQVKRMLPGREQDIDMLNDQAYFDTKFTFMPQQYNIRRKGFLAYDEYWYLADRMATFVVDPETYESTEVQFDKQDLENLKNQFPHIVVVKEKVPTVKLAIIVNNTCFYDGPNPLGIDMYPYTVFVGYHDLANNNYAFRYQGATRNIRDPAYLYSYRKQLELDLLAAQFSGVDVEEDALIDDQDAFKVGPGKVRFFKKNRLQALVDKPGAVINPGNFQATQFLKEDVNGNAGVTPELLGQAEDSDVGITEQLRQGAALTTLQELFDNVDLSQCYAGELHWEIIQKNYTLGKIRKMIEEEPTNEFRDKSFQKYEAVVTQAPLTATTQQLGLSQLLALQERGINIPASYLMKNIVIQDKDKLIEEVERMQQGQQQQKQQMAQLEIENQRIVNESLQSKAISDRALAEERIEKGHLEQMQIVTAHNKSEHEKASATLNIVKAAKEVQSAHVEDFVKVFSLIENIQKRQDENSLAQEEIKNAQS
jgi:hypothetical protein